MRRRMLVLLVLVALAAALSSHAPATTPRARATHAPKRTPPPLPIIYHTQTSALCSALVQHIKPIIGMMQQNDLTISQSPPLFRRYNDDLANQDPHDPSADAGERDLTLYHLEQLVGPLSRNVLAIQRVLEDPNVFPPNPTTDDQRKLDEMRDSLLKALAAQAATMDLISGYVSTQQLAELQHEGTEGANINAIQGGDLAPGSSPNPATPNPLLVDPNQVAGISPNPYSIDPLSIPGIAGSVGNTPVSRLLAAIQWIRAETQQRENAAAQPIIRAANACRAAATSSPRP
jgi:hypothetical protein